MSWPFKEYFLIPWQTLDDALYPLQARLAKHNRMSSRELEQLTEKRNRRILHELHVASRRIIDVLMEHGIGTFIAGIDLLWKQEANMGRRTNSQFVQLPHVRLVELLTYIAALVGITVHVTEEAYTSRASFFDLDPIPECDSHRQKSATFSGKRIARSLNQTKDGGLLHADVNGSVTILRKVVPTAFDVLGMGSPQ
jgi:putative transposase